MRKILNNLNKRLTTGYVLGVLVSFIGAVLFRFAFCWYLEVVPVKGGLTNIDICFFISLVTLRLVFAVLLEYFLGYLYDIPFSDVITLRMEGDRSGGDPASQPSSSKPSSSKPSSSKPSSSEPSPELLKMEKNHKLLDDMQDNLDRQWKMIIKLRELKLSKDVKLYLDKEGGLDIDIPSHTSSEEANKISKEVGIIDRILNTTFSEYKKLQKDDSISNDKKFGDALRPLKDFYKEEYNDLFEKGEEKK